MNSYDPQIHIGEEHGIDIITRFIEYISKGKQHKYMYEIECKICGNKRIRDYQKIKHCPTKNCNHRNKITLNKCLNCEQIIPIENLTPHKYKNRKFCSQKCYHDYKNKHLNRNNQCLNCNNKISYNRKYCSIYCQHQYEQNQWEQLWLSGKIDGNINSVWTSASDRVKNYLLKKYDNKCSRCGWSEINPYTNTLPLEIEHIDGNPYNTSPDNVTLLCPNCHSLTKTYKGANRGRGRNRTWIPTPIETEM